MRDTGFEIRDMDTGYQIWELRFEIRDVEYLFFVKLKSKSWRDDLRLAQHGSAGDVGAWRCQAQLSIEYL